MSNHYELLRADIALVSLSFTTVCIYFDSVVSFVEEL